MICKIWERHFFLETLKVFLLIIVCFFGLYVIADYAGHANAQHYHHAQLKIGDLVRTYTYELFRHLDALVPFALMVAAIRTLTQSNTSNEHVALCTSGVKKKAILRPFIWLALLCVAMMYMNAQYSLPYALKELRRLDDFHTRMKNKKNAQFSVQNLALKDNSTFLYQEFDPGENEFFDAYWIKSFNEIYRFKYLSMKDKVPLGKTVDVLVREPSGNLVKKESYKEISLPAMRFNKKVLLDTLMPPEELSLTKLWGKLPKKKTILNEKESEIQATFAHKLVMPWLSLLAVLLPAPFCLRFTRMLPVFMIYACSLFCLFALYVTFDAALFLASRQVFPALWGITVPFAVALAAGVWQYARLK